MKKFTYKPSDAKIPVEALFVSESDNQIGIGKEILNQYNTPIYILDESLPPRFIQVVEKMTGKKPKAIVRIRAGQKSISKLAFILNAMVAIVPDVAIVIGGGAICDLAGVACATYQRGIPRVLFPTTVLALVDASIGGKTGIDLGGVKNSVGAIHYPILTISYLPFLSSLSSKEYISGFSEIVKAAVLYDRNFFEQLLHFSKKSSDQKKSLTQDIFFSSAAIKARICEEKEGGKIRLLYGHAIGHAIESTKSMHLRHGDCVSIGMHIEGAMACLMKVWNKEEWYKQYKLMRDIGLPIDLPKKINIQEITEKMLLYKKLVNRDNYLFVLPEKIGSVHNRATNYLTPIPKKSMKKILKKSLEWAKKNADV